MYTDMEMWRDVRRRVLVEGQSKRGICREYGIHFQTLQKILAHPAPPGYRQTQPREKRKIGHYLPIIDGVYIIRSPFAKLRGNSFPILRNGDRMRTTIASCWIFLLALVASAAVFAADDVLVEKGCFAFEGDRGRLYRIDTPRRIKKGELYPLLLALHGYDGQSESFIRLYAPHKDGSDWFVVAPQAPAVERKGRVHSTWSKTTDLPYLLQLLDKLSTRYPVDPKRITVVGYSAGAGMALHLFINHPDCFAGLGLFAGGNIGEKSAALFAGKQAYLLGGQKDGSFNAGRVQTIKALLEKAGAKVRSAVIPGADHASVYKYGVRMADWIYSPPEN